MPDNTLIERLEALTAPRREVDKELCVAVLGYKHDVSGCYLIEPNSTNRVFGWPNVTGSIDAAMTLTRTDAEAIGVLQSAIDLLEDDGWPKGDWWKQLPRYICITAIRAREATNA